MSPRYATQITRNMHDLWPIDFTYVIQWGGIIKDIIFKKNKSTKYIVQFLKIIAL